MKGHIDRTLTVWLEGDELFRLGSMGDDGWYLAKPGKPATDGVFVGFAEALRLLAKAATEAAQRQDEDDGKVDSAGGGRRE